MRALLDTHVLLWWLDGDDRLSEAAHDLIADPANPIFVSAASAWEISVKVAAGRLPGAEAVTHTMPHCVIEQAFEMLPISLVHARRAGALPPRHADPFDRMLAAQAHAEDLVIVSDDPIFGAYGVRRVW